MLFVSLDDMHVFEVNTPHVASSGSGRRIHWKELLAQWTWPRSPTAQSWKELLLLLEQAPHDSKVLARSNHNSFLLAFLFCKPMIVPAYAVVKPHGLPCALYKNPAQPTTALFCDATLSQRLAALVGAWHKPSKADELFCCFKSFDISYFCKYEKAAVVGKARNTTD